MAQEPVLRAVWKPSAVGRREDPAFVSPEVELQSLTRPESRSLAPVFGSNWHRAWHIQGAPGISVECTPVSQILSSP